MISQSGNVRPKKNVRIIIQFRNGAFAEEC